MSVIRSPFSSVRRICTRFSAARSVVPPASVIALSTVTGSALGTS